MADTFSSWGGRWRSTKCPSCGTQGALQSHEPNNQEGHAVWMCEATSCRTYLYLGKDVSPDILNSMGYPDHLRGDPDE